MVFRPFWLIWRRHHYQWKAANFDLCRSLWPLSNESSLACHTYCNTHGTSVYYIMVISEGPRHLHLLPSVWQWNCRYVFQRLRSVASGIRTPDLPLTGRALKPTVHRPRLYFKKLIVINNWIRWSCREKMGFRNKHVIFLCLNTIFVSKFL